MFHITSPQIDIHSVLASRILFDLRTGEGRPRIHTTLTDVSGMHFRGGQISTVVFDV